MKSITGESHMARRLDYDLDSRMYGPRRKIGS
jgi:hypothetical protein